jgi:hypothetical protein
MEIENENIEYKHAANRADRGNGTSVSYADATAS